MNKKIKVNLVFQEYPLFYQPYIKLLVDKLKTSNALNISFTFFKAKEKSSESDVFIMPSYRSRRIKEIYNKLFNPLFKKLTYPEIYWIKKKTDIIHLQHSFLYPHILNIVKFPNIKRPKVVITLRGADTYIKPWTMERWKFFYSAHGNNLDAFITVSKHQKKYLMDWGIREEKIHVIPISFGTRSDAKPKYSSENEIKIVSAFRMCWEKNIDGNIRVIKSLVDKGHKVTYDIYGDGQDLGQVFYLINRYQLQDHVSFKGKIENAKFKEILSDYDFYLQLSLSESAGATAIEAQSKGVPCIVSDSDGLSEMISNNKTGYAIPHYDVDAAADRIIDLYINKEAYYSFSKRAIEYVNENFSVEMEVKRLLKLYTQLI